MKILGFTGSRADYYLQRTLFRRFQDDTDITFGLIVSGNIPSESSHTTLNDIIRDGFDIVGTVQLPVDFKLSSHSSQIYYLGLEIEPILRSFNPDIAIAYADRYVTFAFALSAFHNDIIVYHLEAGDITQGGTYDDSLRHCITKISHLQGSSTQTALKVVHSLGEEVWRSKVVGLLSYESMHNTSIRDAYQVHDDLCLAKENPLLIVTMHPIPSTLDASLKDNDSLLKALVAISKIIDVDIIITAPNHDHGGHLLLDQIHSYLPKIKSCQFIENLGGHRYFSLLSLATNKIVIVCGNSSSIIKEAPYFGAHGLNIGNRQFGRESASTQMDVAANPVEIQDAILGLSRKPCKIGYNPYLADCPSQLAASFLKDVLCKKSKAQILLKLWPNAPY